MLRLLRWLLVVDLLNHGRLLVVQALCDSCPLFLILNLLLHAVVEHAEAEKIDRHANEAANNDNGKDPCFQLVKAFFGAVKEVDHSFVVHALLCNVFSQPVRPDRHDNDSNQEAEDIQNRADHVGIVQKLAVKYRVLVNDNQSEEDQEDRLKACRAPVAVDHGENHIEADQATQNPRSNGQSASAAALIVFRVQTTHLYN